MKIVGGLAAAFVVYAVVMAMALGSAMGGAGGEGLEQTGAFAPGVNIGLDAEQIRNAEISLRVADQLNAPDLAVLAEVVAALGESGFRAIPNHAGSGYCGVFQADPDNVPCNDTKQQATRFLIGGKGFQAGGAIHLAKTVDWSPGTIATKVEASGEPGSFYDAHRPQAEQIIAAWRSGGSRSLSVTIEDGNADSVLSNPHIFLTPGQRADIESGGIDPRVLMTMAWLGSKHEITITALRKDHRPGTNHEKGQAFDVGAVDKWICRGGRQDPCADAVRELAQVQGPTRSTELIYCWDPDPADPNMFAQADHCDHFHVGWDGAPAPASAVPQLPERAPTTARVLLTGDSIAVGTGTYMNARVVATIGIGSRLGVQRILGDEADVLAVSLGANDSDSDDAFEGRVRQVMRGRKCVAWALIPSRPKHNAALRDVARDDSRLRLVSVDPGPDGVHPTANGYRALAADFDHALNDCR